MTDMVIPPEAVEQLARALYARDGYAPWETEELDVILEYRAEARSLLEAALPHLRPMLERVVEIHHHDIEKSAEHFNEGYDEANRQGIGGEGSRSWLIGKVGPILEPHFADWDEVADQIADGLLSEADLSDPDTKALVETATRLGRELGRREAAEEIAAAQWNHQGPGPSPTSPAWWAGYGEAQRDMVKIAREIATKLGHKEAT